jgi:hypothetical protein
MILFWVAGQVGLAAVAVLAVGSSSIRRTVAALFLAAGAVLPWLAPSFPPLRVGLGFLALVAFLKTTRICSCSEDWPIRTRVGHMVSIFHVRNTRPVPPSVPMVPVLYLALHAALACLAVAVLVALRHGQVPARSAIRLASGVGLLYGTIACLWDLSLLGYALSGIAVPHDQFAPLHSISLREFWGRRWNTFLGDWLRHFLFLPLARRDHPALGILCAFATSAAMHGWLALIPLGWRAALMMASFFLVQGVFVLVETRLLDLPSWRAPAARAWTLGLLLAPSPLGIDPFLRAFGL